MKKIDFCILKVTEVFCTDPHPDPDSYHNVRDPEHWIISQRLRQTPPPPSHHHSE
jgi:hypothetical protein